MSAIVVQKDARETFLKLITSRAQEFIAETFGSDQGKALATETVLAFRNAAAVTPDLYTCTPGSIAQCVALVALTKLSPRPFLPEVYLLPYQKSVKTDKGWDKIKELQFQISWRGYHRLASRGGARLKTNLVFKGETFEERLGTRQELIHDRNAELPRSWETILCGYTVANFKDERPNFEVLYKPEIEKRRAESKSYTEWLAHKDGTKKKEREPVTPVWVKWDLEMALKTTVRYSVSREIVPLDEIGKIGYHFDALQDAKGDEVEEAPAVFDADYQPAGAPTLPDYDQEREIQNELFSNAPRKKETLESRLGLEREPGQEG